MNDVQEKYGIEIKTVGSIGFSAMMHGYLALDKDDNQLAEFRTWRNTSTEEAATKLTEELQFNIPQRWSIAHLYQAMLNKEEQVASVAYMTTLAGYVHYCLTGEKVLGIGDASGVFPIDSTTNNYDLTMSNKFDAIANQMGYGWKLQDILPQVLVAGADAGVLTAKGDRKSVV